MWILPSAILLNRVEPAAGETLGKARSLKATFINCTCDIAAAISAAHTGAAII